MSDERIHKHDWQSGRCKICGIEKAKAESELAEARGWKHEPVTSEQAEQIAECLRGIRWRLSLLIYFALLIWIILLGRQ